MWSLIFMLENVKVKIVMDGSTGLFLGINDITDTFRFVFSLIFCFCFFMLDLAEFYLLLVPQYV